MCIGAAGLGAASGEARRGARRLPASVRAAAGQAPIPEEPDANSVPAAVHAGNTAPAVGAEEDAGTDLPDAAAGPGAEAEAAGETSARPKSAGGRAAPKTGRGRGRGRGARGKAATTSALEQESAPEQATAAEPDQAPDMEALPASDTAPDQMAVTVAVAGTQFQEGADRAEGDASGQVAEATSAPEEAAVLKEAAGKKAPKRGRKTAQVPEEAAATEGMAAQKADQAAEALSGEADALFEAAMGKGKEEAKPVGSVQKVFGRRGRGVSTAAAPMEAAGEAVPATEDGAAAPKASDKGKAPLTVSQTAAHALAHVRIPIDLSRLCVQQLCSDSVTCNVNCLQSLCDINKLEHVTCLQV